MQPNKRWIILAVFSLSAAVLWSADTKSVATTIQGYVVDSACAFNKNLDKPVSRNCALACARGQSLLVVLGNDGVIYWPISATMPAQGQNGKLLPFAGRKVIVKGKVIDRGGSRALILESVQLLQDKK